MFSAIKTNSVLGDPAQNFSGLAFNDTPQQEHVALYSEKDLLVNAENNHVHHVGSVQYTKVGRTSLTKVGALPLIGGGGGGGPGATGETVEGDEVQSGLITSIGQTPQWQVSLEVALPNFGFGGTTIYGINSQDTVGFMHQITCFQATQIVINPFKPWGYIPPPTPGITLPPAAPSSVGGNQQLCWGTNYQCFYGPNVSYSSTGSTNYTGTPGPTTITMAKLIPVMCLLYEVVYGALGNNLHPLPELVATAFSVALILCNRSLITSQTMDQSVSQAKAALALVQATEDMATVTYPSVLEPTLADFMGELAAKTKISFTQPQLATTVPLEITDPAHSISFTSGDSLVYAQNCHLFAFQPPVGADGEPNETANSTIYINAFGNLGTGGVVIINATKQMSLTSGNAYIGLVNNPATLGDLALQCGLQGTISLRRQPVLQDHTVQNITMAYSPQAPEITIDGGPNGQVNLFTGPAASENGSAIILRPLCQGLRLVCGQNSIDFTTQGITINALNITLNSTVNTAIKSLKTDIVSQLGHLGITLAQHTG
jgi:hypothetical protein